MLRAREFRTGDERFTIVTVTGVVALFCLVGLLAWNVFHTEADGQTAARLAQANAAQYAMVQTGDRPAGSSVATAPTRVQGAAARSSARHRSGVRPRSAQPTVTQTAGNAPLAASDVPSVPSGTAAQSVGTSPSAGSTAVAGSADQAVPSLPAGETVAPSGGTSPSAGAAGVTNGAAQTVPAVESRAIAGAADGAASGANAVAAASDPAGARSPAVVRSSNATTVAATNRTPAADLSPADTTPTDTTPTDTTPTDTAPISVNNPSTIDANGFATLPNQDIQQMTGAAPGFGKFFNVWTPRETGTGQWVIGPGGTAPADADPAKTLILKPGQGAVQVDGTYVAYDGMGGVPGTLGYAP